MKRILVFTLLSCALLVACSSGNKHQVAPYPRGYEVPPDTTMTSTEVNTGTPVESGTTSAASTPKPTPPTAVVPTQREAKYATPEPGKPGFGRSPYHPEAGLIDFRGYPPATEVKDPFTPGKILLVP